MTAVTIEVSPPASAKNRRRLYARENKVLSFPSKEAVASEKEIRAAWEQALGMRTTRYVLHESDDVEMNIRYHVADERVEISVSALRSRKKGRTGRKRDLHGMIETIADALQGFAYSNDNQIAKLTIERIP